MEDVKEFLRSIGFGKNEAEIYETLVKEGSLCILDISKKTKIHRSNIYEAVDFLIRQGIVWEVNDSNRRIFSARPPVALVNYLKQKEVELKSIAQKMVMKQNPDNEGNVRLSKGKFALKEALQGLFTTGQDIYVFGIPNFAVEIIGPIIMEYHKERMKKKITMKHIYNSDAVERAKFLNKMPYTIARCSPEKYDSRTTTNVSGNKIVLINWNKNLSIIEITDKDLADTYRKHFEQIWKHSKVV